jgi:decaprenylphospho-beta-D-erythro-pentofuranosid-2-ulose 2-reductase
LRTILIFGATSAIAEAAARRWVSEGPSQFFLVGRNTDRLARIAADLVVRGAKRADFMTLDLNDLEGQGECMRRISQSVGAWDIALVAHGTLGDQGAAQESVTETVQQLHTNAISAIALLTLLANAAEAQKSGAILAITSVAGDRGRQSNYVYGAAKGAVTLFLQGMRQRLSKSRVRVVTIKPGFVDTPMTANFRKGVLWSSPDEVARVICSSASAGPEVVYAPRFWAIIMFAIRVLPEPIFKRLTL